MRVAVTDYDGTLNIRGKVPEKALDAVRRWREAGNIFGIATGRDLSMILPETEKWQIPYDFLICCNGAAIYGPGPELEVLYSAAIADPLVPRVLTHPAGQASMHYELCSDGVVHLYVRSEESWFPGLGFPYEALGYEDALTMTGLQQICFAYASAAEGEEYADALNEAFAGRLRAHQNGRCIDITGGGISKASGIAELLAMRQWPERGLLAVGDGGNDLPMIRRYGGFSVAGAAAAVQREATAVYDDVGEMLLAHLDSAGKQQC